MINIFSFNVENLRLWLTWELSASSLFFLSFFRIATLYILGPVIVLFIPVLIGTLYLERRYGWLIFYALFVLTPSIFIYFIIDSGTWYFALQFFPIGLFLFYCLLLRLTVAGWESETEDIPDLQI
ncbi:hypothetical protein [Rhodohalobacter sp. 8-1]|uniref:hypothetical protein n=1 Tax=Rhodohalobacter sp. 8-1 TaxID=3131972 RepID=UPI0030ED9B33